MKPKDEKQLADAVRSAAEPFALIGTGTKRALGRPVEAQELDLSSFSKVIAYEPEELILEAAAATKLSDIEKLLAKKNQMLAFEPPDFSKLLGSIHSGTIGGALMCNLSGPRRLKAGAARDHVLGVTGVNGNGDIFKAGARVVKNVTGYDVPRLLAGSYGTLAALTSITFKVLPRPETEITLQVNCASPDEAVAIMAKAMQSSAEVSSAAYLPGRGVCLRLEGIEASVYFRSGLLHSDDQLGDVKSKNLWADIRDCVPLVKKNPHHIWRASVAPMAAPQVIANLQAKHDVEFFMDWAGGLIWIAAEPGVDVRSFLTSGHAMLFHADEKARRKMDVFQPQPPELAALSARVKHAFDPKRLFNPGRMYRAI